MNDVSPAFPWPACSATGVGSMPGTNPAEAIAVVLGELPDLPYLPELPARGPGADITGRTAAMLVDFPVETTAGRWKASPRPGRDQRRAAGLLAADLDAVQEAAGDWKGPFKIGVCGPWTLAATIELSRSQNPVLADPGAVADLIASLAEGVAAHLAEVRGRIPGATVLLQLDEPALPAVLAGSVPTASGLNRVGAVDTAVTRDGLQSLLDIAPSVGIVHCCARQVPFKIFKDAGARAVAFDLSLVRPGGRDQDELAEVVEAGLGVLAGVPDLFSERPGSSRPGDAREIVAAVTDLWHRMGIPAAGLERQVVLTPACGLAGASPAGARAALARCREAARMLPELIEESSA
ncbi:MAG TPA: methionine synthase [Streptosporangiaceae bacterium]|nr:methionine synthase [Streptosporangiaceae bacterium]